MHKDTYAKRTTDHKAAQGFRSKKSLGRALWTTRRPNFQRSLVHHKGLHKARDERYDKIRRNAQAWGERYDEFRRNAKEYIRKQI